LNQVTSTTRQWQRILVAALLLASVAEFTIRGPARLLLEGVGWNDFLSPYIQANAWAHGKDPYSSQSLISQWPPAIPRPPFVDSEAAAGKLERKRGIPSPYPLTTLVIISLLTVLPWRAALLLWSFTSTSAVILAALALLDMCECRLERIRSQIFLATVLALAPVHTGLATANPAMLAVSLVIGACWALRKRRPKMAALLLAVAICLKPTVAGGLLLYFAIRRRWVTVLWTCGVTAIAGLVGVVRMFVAGTAWLPSYLENSRRMFAAGSVDDFTRTVALRFNMVNSQVFFGGIFSNPSTISWLSRFLGVALLGCWILLCFRRKTSTGLLEVSAVSVLSLVAVYHRFYDAALLIFPLAWMVLVATRRTAQIAALAAVAPFFIPGPILLSQLADSGRIPAVITHGWWWNAVILPHEAWDLIILACLLLYFLWRESPEARVVAEAAE
jgi:hypothetical protein